MFDWQVFLDDVAGLRRGDYASAFKMLGVVVYVREKGIEALLAGQMVSPRTVYRWLETIRAAGWGRFISEVRILQAIKEHLESLEEPDEEQVRESLTRLVDAAFGQEATS